MGIAMIVQVLWGHRLPLIIGPASVLLIGILSTVSSGIPAVYTGIIVTVILILIAFTLTPVILKLVLGDAIHALFNLFFTLVMVLALVIGNKLLRGIWKSTTVLWGIVGGVLVYYGVFGFPTLVSTGAGIIPEQATVFNFPLNFEAGTILAFLLYSFDCERAWFDTSRRTYVTG